MVLYHPKGLSFEDCVLGTEACVTEEVSKLIPGSGVYWRGSVSINWIGGELYQDVYSSFRCNANMPISRPLQAIW